MQGYVKWFSDQKGFGFIIPEHGGCDVFVHHTSIKNKLSTLQDGEKVEFDANETEKGIEAIDVVVDR